MKNEKNEKKFKLSYDFSNLIGSPKPKPIKIHNNNIKKIQYPMLADPAGKLARFFGVLVEEEGQALRGTFVVDPDGKIKAYEIHDMGIGRNASELLRKVQAAKFVAEHGDQVCPAKWKPGEETLTPSLDLVGLL